MEYGKNINMQQKHYLVIGMMAIILSIGIIFISIAPFEDMGTTEPSIALSPYVEFEGSVVSLSLDESRNYSEGNEIVSLPNDSAVIRIDKIIETGGSNFNWSSLGIEEGKEVKLYFKYTARPAKIITVIGETKQSVDTVSHAIVPTKITFEDEYFIFRIDGNRKTKKILQGLKIGSKFKTKILNTYEVKIEEYNII
jgi:hypothetical protein